MHNVREISKYEIAKRLTNVLVEKGSVIPFQPPKDADMDTIGPDGKERMEPYLFANSVQPDAMRLFQIHHLMSADVAARIGEIQASGDPQLQGTSMMYMFFETPGDPKTALFGVGQTRISS